LAPGEDVNSVSCHSAAAAEAAEAELRAPEALLAAGSAVMSAVLMVGTARVVVA
jgi:hypothetical protein